MSLIIQSKRPLPIPNEVKSNLFWVLKTGLFSTSFFRISLELAKKGHKIGCFGSQ